MAALLALSLDFNQDLLGSAIDDVTYDCEPSRTNLPRLLAVFVLERFGKRTIEIDPVIAREVRIERHSKQSVFEPVEDTEFSRKHDASVWFDHSYPTVAFDVKNSSIRSDRQLHRVNQAGASLGRILSENDLPKTSIRLEPKGHRFLCVGFSVENGGSQQQDRSFAANDVKALHGQNRPIRLEKIQAVRAFELED